MDKLIKQIKIELELLIDSLEDVVTITKQGLDAFDNFESKHTLHNIETIDDEVTKVKHRLNTILMVVKMIYEAKEQQNGK